MLVKVRGRETLFQSWSDVVLHQDWKHSRRCGWFCIRPGKKSCGGRGHTQPRRSITATAKCWYPGCCLVSIYLFIPLVLRWPTTPPPLSSVFSLRVGSKRWNVNKSIRARNWELQLPLWTIKRLFMLPWRAIPVTLAHWREPQIISYPSVCLPPTHSPPPGFPSSCAPGPLFPLSFFFHFHSFMFFSLSPSLAPHTAEPARLFFLFDFSLSYLSFIPNALHHNPLMLSALPLLRLYIPTPTRAFQASSPHPPKPSKKKKKRKERLLDHIYYKISNVVSVWERFTGRKKKPIDTSCWLHAASLRRPEEKKWKKK